MAGWHLQFLNHTLRKHKHLLADNVQLGVATSVQEKKANERLDASASTVSHLQKEDPGVQRVEADALFGTLRPL